MKPDDILTVVRNNGASFRWVVSGVYLGSVGQESVVELEPIEQRPSGLGRTLCPAQLLDVLAESGQITVENP